MYKPKDTKERVIHRLKIAHGHLEKVIQMVRDDEYCIDILHQSTAVQKALEETDNLILEDHLNSCVIRSIREGKEGQVITEVMNVFRRSKLNR